MLYQLLNEIINAYHAFFSSGALRIFWLAIVCIIAFRYLALFVVPFILVDFFRIVWPAISQFANGSFNSRLYRNYLNETFHLDVWYVQCGYIAMVIYTGYVFWRIYGWNWRYRTQKKVLRKMHADRRIELGLNNQ